jgi:hypothetical protein
VGRNAATLALVLRSLPDLSFERVTHERSHLGPIP